MNVLILGGTGAMGVSLVEILTKEHHNVWVTSRSVKTSSSDNLHYLLGNAHNIDFLKQIISEIKYDVIVDFMFYSSTEFFKDRLNIFLNNTKHYIFLSSARVYNNLQIPITENAPRLLDSSNDEAYLKTDEYALTKAREENILGNHSKKNWTIIRPYITYNVERLQLGVFEKENWLYRALHGRKIVFSKDIANSITTLTYGYDLSFLLSKILCKEKAFGQVYHITSNISKTWSEILNIYVNILSEELNRIPEIIWIDKASKITMCNQYQIKYCRLFKRIFDNSKILSFCPNFSFTEYKQGLNHCLKEFLNSKRKFKNINWIIEAQLDKITNEITPLAEISGYKNKIRYLLYRFTPFHKIRYLLYKLVRKQ